MPPPVKVPLPTLERLATYLRLLYELEQQNVPTISSADVEQHTGIAAPQFRKDLSYFGDFGKPGVGYDVAALLASIARILKVDRARRILLIGTGNLGAALIGYPGMSEHNFHIAAAFDNNPAKVGQHFSNLHVRDISTLAHANREIGAKMAILAVPAAAAQEVADACVAAGIEVMLNFAPTHIRVPSHVHVRNVSFLQELAVLSYNLDEQEGET